MPMFKSTSVCVVKCITCVLFIFVCVCVFGSVDREESVFVNYYSFYHELTSYG